MSDWTPERVNQLTALWTSGISCSAIAKQMGDGLTRNSIVGKAHRLGLLHRIDMTASREVRAVQKSKFLKRKAEQPTKPLPSPKPLKPTVQIIAMPRHNPRRLCT